MAFSTNCTNKGCGKFQAPYIDKDTNKVYCSECDKEINNLTQFTKSQMKSLKQYKPKTQISFQVKCPSCNKEDRPVIVNNNIQCKKCGDSLENLSKTFKDMLKIALKNIDKEI